MALIFKNPTLSDLLYLLTIHSSRPILAMKLVVPIWVVVILGKIPHSGGAKLLCL